MNVLSVYETECAGQAFEKINNLCRVCGLEPGTSEDLFEIHKAIHYGNTIDDKNVPRLLYGSVSDIEDYLDKNNLSGKTEPFVSAVVEYLESNALFNADRNNSKHTLKRYANNVGVSEFTSDMRDDSLVAHNLALKFILSPRAFGVLPIYKSI